MARETRPRKDRSERARNYPASREEVPELHEAGGVSEDELDRRGEAGPERGRERHDRTRDRELNREAE